MSKILIVSRTRMNKGICVGAIDLDTHEMIRVHDENGENLKKDAPYHIGEIWEVKYMDVRRKRPDPHSEDKNVISGQLIRSIGESGFKDYIHDNLHNLPRYSDGKLADTYDGNLSNEGGRKLFIEENVPDHSTRFWTADIDLLLFYNFDKPNYRYESYEIPYVGTQEPIEIIPAGTIVRLSLASWWKKNPDTPERCYLQVSGWYL